MGDIGWAWLASAVTFAVAMTATPGPNNAMLTASGATWGLRRTMPHMLGITIGFPVMLLGVSLGLGEVMRASPWLQAALRWIGAAYLVWLAWAIATARPKPASAGPPASRGRPLGFVRAALFQWVNPKAWVIAMGAVVTYTTRGEAVSSQAAILALIFLAVTWPITLFWTSVGVGAARMLRTERGLRRFNYALAVLLVASLVPILWNE